jgi:hypothetical protein
MVSDVLVFNQPIVLGLSKAEHPGIEGMVQQGCSSLEEVGKRETEKQRKRERERKGRRGDEIAFKSLSPLMCFLKSGPTSYHHPIMSSSHKSINGLIR